MYVTTESRWIVVTSSYLTSSLFKFFKLNSLGQADINVRVCIFKSTKMLTCSN